jgi:hypothetical protein
MEANPEGATRVDSYNTFDAVELLPGQENSADVRLGGMSSGSRNGQQACIFLVYLFRVSARGTVCPKIPIGVSVLPSPVSVSVSSSSSLSLSLSLQVKPGPGGGTVGDGSVFVAAQRLSS